MKCLLVAATSAEIAPFMRYYRTSRKSEFIDFELSTVITGVGAMASAYHITNAIANNKPDLIVMLGIAGAFNKNLALGQVVVVQKEVVADMGVMEKGKWVDMFDLQLIKPNHSPYYKRMLYNKNKALLKRTRLQQVTGVTVNQITTDAKWALLLQKKYGAEVESMEGAALHLVANSKKIPYFQIRGISNYVTERNKKNWNIKEAIANSNKVLIHLFESL